MMLSFRRWFRQLHIASTARRRRVPSWRSLEALEARTLLAGNVAAVVSGGNLLLTGDSAANTVQVTVRDGDVIVEGLDGTTINGQATPFVAVDNGTTIAGLLTVALGGGDDTFRLQGPITVRERVTIADKHGTTRVGITAATLQDDLIVLTGKRSDAVSLLNTTIAGNTHFSLGRGNNQLALMNTDVTGNFSVRTKKGADDVVLQDSEIGGAFHARTGRGADNIVVEDTQVTGNLVALTGAGADFVLFDGAQVTGHAALWLQGGSDFLVTQNTNSVGGSVVAGGILGRHDAIQISAETTVTGERRILRFEEQTVPASVIDARGTNGAIARANTLRAALNLDADDLGPLTLTVDTSNNTNTVDSDGTVVTSLQSFNIRGTTLAGSTIEVTAGTNGSIDLGTTTADTDGNYSLNVNLLEGPTTIMVQTTDVLGRTLTEDFELHRAVGQVMRFQTTLGTFDVELLEDDAPNTVANFLDYLERYEESIIHRSGQGTGTVPSVIQGGGFVFDGDSIEPITTDPAIINEFLAGNSNLRGTLSMALPPGNPDGGTSQWFINTANNAFLDSNRHTVFGQVIESGLDVVDAINDVMTFDITAVVTNDQGALTDVPLQNYTPLTRLLTGTVSVGAGGSLVTGTGTQFLSELEERSVLQIAGQQLTVATIVSDTQLFTTAPHTAGATGVSALTNAAPGADNLVRITSISQLLA
jgi:cyclophilin family peptidyl-prolyl cis-trans isomerase